MTYRKTSLRIGIFLLLSIVALQFFARGGAAQSVGWLDDGVHDSSGIGAALFGFALINENAEAFAPCVAGEKTWDGEGATNNWSEAANWTCDAVPSGTDIVKFDATSTRNATIDVNAFADDLRLNSGYTGTVSTAPGVAFSFGRNLASFFTSSQAAGSFVCGSGSTVSFIRTTFTMTGGNFDCRNGSVTLDIGRVNINGGTFDAPTGTLTLQGFSAVGSALNLNAGGSFNHNGGTIVTSSDGGSLTGLTQPLIVNNLIFNGQTSQNLADSVVRVLGNLTLASGGQLTGALRSVWELHGNLTVGNGAPSGSRANVFITFAGSGSQTFVNTGGLNPLATWRLNKPSGQLILQSDLIDFGDLQLDSGILNAGAFTVDIGLNTATGGNASSYVIGKLRRTRLSDSTTHSYPVGTPAGYAPATAIFSGNGSTITVDAKDGVHPAMNPTTSLGRYWTVSQTGSTSANLTFAYQNADVNGNENLYATARINNGVQFLAPATAAQNLLTAAGETLFGDFTAGETLAPCIPGEKTWDGEGTTNNWSEAANWSCNAVPATTDRAVFNGASNKNATIDTNVTIKTFEIDGYTGTVTNASAVLTVQDSGSVGLFRQSSGTFNGGTGTINLTLCCNSAGPSGFRLQGGTFISTSGTLNIDAFSGSVIDSGATFQHNSGTVNIIGTRSGSVVIGGTATELVFNNLGIQTTANFQNTLAAFARTVTTEGTLTVNGRTDAGSVVFRALGSVTVGASSGSGASNLLFAGGANQTFANLGGTFPFQRVTIDKTAGTVTANSPLALRSANDDLFITNGTLYAASGANVTARTINIGANGRFVNDSSFTLTVGTGVVNDGIVDFQGGGAACNETPGVDPITIISSNLAQKPWTGSGVQRLVDVSVTRMGGTGTKTVYSGTNVTGNSAAWVFDAGCPPAVAISPLTATLQTGATQTFTAGGGFAPYAFSIPTNNSGATIDAAGLYTAGATIGVTDIVRVTDVFGQTADASVSVVGVPTRLGFTVQPQNAAAGATLPAITIAVQDASGNTIPNVPKLVQLALVASNGAVLAGTTSATTVNGVGSFNNLNIATAGTYTITASASGLTAATSDPFTIAAGAPTQLAFTVQPSGAVNGAALSPAVRVSILDALGNVVPTATSAVTIGLASNPGAASLGGTTTVGAVGGAAIFSDLSVSAPGAGYTLRATSAGLTESTSSPFDISSLVVTNTGDSGPGSLRQAILDSNAIPGSQSITFDIPGAAPYSIALQSSLPNLTSTVTIDATTQPGYTSSPIVELNGAATNGGTGFFVAAPNCVIRGFVINRFRNAGNGAGIVVDGGPFTVIESNYIGTDATGTTALANADGISVRNGSGTRIGGFTALGLNVISGNSANGIRTFSAVTGLNIRGNRIGTNAAGSGSLANFRGISLLASGSAVDGNLISGSLFEGIRISGSNNEVRGNVIGRNAGNSADLPNRDGIVIDNAFSGSSNTIGGASAGFGNVIAGNTVNGVRVSSSGVVTNAARNRINGNSIFGNGSFGIKLTDSPTGQTPLPNDPRDPDAYSNNRQNYPTVASAFDSGGGLTIAGTLNSAPSQSFRLEFFSSPACDASGFGEGKTFLGSTNATTPASGIAGFSVTLPGVGSVGEALTATATDADGNTSEFSKCVSITPPPQPVSGRVTDNNGTPLGGVLVQTSYADPLLNRVVATATDGTFSFLAPFGSSPTITPGLANYTFAPSSRIISNIAGAAAGQNFTGTRNAAIRGRVTATAVNNATLPLSNVLLTLDGDPGRVARTDVNGSYVFSGVTAGSHSVTPSLEGFTFAPVSRTVTLAGTDVTANFSSSLAPPDGRLYFPSPASPGKIATAAVFGAGRVDLPQSVGVGGVSDVSRDGRRLLGSAGTNTAGGACCVSHVFISNFDSSDFQLVVTVGQNSGVIDAEWSPDETRFAYIQDDFVARQRRGVRIANANGTIVGTAYTASNYNKVLSSLDWSAASGKLVFVEHDTVSNAKEIKTVSADGLGPVTLLTSPSLLGQRVSNDGDTILFLTTVNAAAGTQRLSTMNIDGTSQTIRLDNLQNIRSAVWSPDDTKILLNYHNGSGSPQRGQIVYDLAAGSGFLTNTFLVDTTGVVVWAPEAGAATNAGANVGVAVGAISVSFGGVTQNGATTVTPISPSSAGTAPGGFVLGSQAYEISTTASVTPPITVCLTVPSSTTLASFNLLSILHSENGVLVDRTASRDFPAKRICAQTTSLSPFVLAEQVDSGLPSITGVIVDQNGAPMAGVPVALTGTEDRTATTDSDGRFAFVNLTPNGDYNVSPRSLGVVFTEFNQDFANLTDEQTVVFTGTPQTFAISGTATDGDGAPLAGVTISLDGSSTAGTATDAGGAYSFAGLPADGTFRLSAQKPGVVFGAPAIVDPLTGDASGVDFAALAPTAAGVSLGGRVATANGQGIRGVIVEISGGNLASPRSVRTGTFGRFSFDGLEAGQTYVVTLRAKRYRFDQPTQVVNLVDSVGDLDFNARE